MFAQALKNLRQPTTTNLSFDDVSVPAIFKQHADMLVECGQKLLKPQRRSFDVDNENRNLFRFLIYYFNECPLAERVFPEKDYRLHKNLMLCGGVGTGKTLTMQTFSLYLELTQNPLAFKNISVTQMINYYKLNGHLNLYTFNEILNSTAFDGKPHNLCLNDLGLKTHLHFGSDTKILIADFLHARNELWTQNQKFTHITTNLDVRNTKETFEDGYGRLVDRFKTYNVLKLGGLSRRE